MFGQFLITAALAVLLITGPALAQATQQEGMTSPDSPTGKSIKKPKRAATPHPRTTKVATKAIQKMTTRKKLVATNIHLLPRECSSSALAERYDGPDSRAPAREC